MIKITLGDLVGSADNIRALQEVKLPIKVSYRLLRLANKLQPFLDDYNKKRNDLIIELGDKQEDGSTKVVEPEKVLSFQGKIKDLFSEQIIIDWFEPIKLEELGDAVVAPKDIISWVFANEDK